MNKKIKVAIAEDQALFRECLAQNINYFENIEVICEAANGAELLEKMTALPDLVILDLNMPVLNGIETTQKLKLLFPEIKIIILSVHDEDRFVARLVNLGVSGYICKTSELSELKKAINMVMESGFYFNETVLKALRSEALTKNKTNDFSLKIDLTQRELEILNLICKEYTTTEMAEKLFISPRTVDGHRNNLLEKTGARNTAGLVLFAVKNNLTEVGAEL
jgi:DNA-binding NarL/FixJ family response regulator